MPSEWKTGDVVMLKSGGPDMTVQKVRGSEIDCHWFEAGTKLQSGVFNEDELETPDRTAL